MIKKSKITNWKLLEVLENIKIINNDSGKYFNLIAKKFDIPLTNFSGVDREKTHIDWSKMANYNKFFSGGEDELENIIAFKNSRLAKKENLVMLYGYDEPTVLIPADLFISDWEDFMASTQWETIIFSEDFELIMEVSRDYNLHSNFKIR